jgi:NADPH:quinone reductase-like Zn-dependent oxidoreductase
MKAIIQKVYGDESTLQLDDTLPPIIKKSNDILIEVKYANISAGDKNINTLNLPQPIKTVMRLVFGFSGPRAKVRGISGSGVVKSVGTDVIGFKAGDHVNFINSINAGVMAEHLLLNSKSKISLVADNVNLEDAAPIAFGALTANHFVNEVSVKKGDSVLIYGASGSVGSYAAQLAKYYGAKVTGVASSKHHDKLKTLKLDYLIDYTKQDITKLETKFDLILDAVGFLPKSKTKNILEDKGKYLTIKSPTAENLTRLAFLNKILSEGKLITVIDKVYSLEEFREAHRKVYDGHKSGNVILRINNKTK